MTDHIAQDRKLVRAEFEEWAMVNKPELLIQYQHNTPSAIYWQHLATWQAATQRQQERIAELEAQGQALSLDAFAKDASIGHLSRLVDAERTDAARYQWLRGRDLETISHGGVFAGKTPDNVILNGEDLDSAIDAAIARATHKEQT